MIDVQEHFYEDNPDVGHPDVRTKLPDVSYFFLGNGLIQAAVQVAPSGQGTAVALLIMNPERLGKKRDALTMDKAHGLENTQVRIISGAATSTAGQRTVEARWNYEYRIPAVCVEWSTAGFRVKEKFYCAELSQPALIREVRITNLKKRKLSVCVQTGILQQTLSQEMTIRPKGEEKIFFRYRLGRSGKKNLFGLAPVIKIKNETLQYWETAAHASFGSTILDHFFNASRFQLPAVIAKSGKVDGSIWQYNREWVRDQAMVAVGLTVSGHHGLARRILTRLLKEFVSEEGDTIDSSEEREADEVELDQNGVLLYALKQYVLWAGDLELVQNNWHKIVLAAEFPLSRVFRHPASGLLANRREYWERHRAHGIQKGMELAHQLFASIGLFSAAIVARLVGYKKIALRWEREAERLRTAMLDEARFGLVDSRGFIKRRGVDGFIQETITPSAGAQLPRGVPLADKREHLLNPDTSTALPVATGFILPDSDLSRLTLAHLEILWNQVWQGGGYGRYNFSSEPDSPGAWPFPSLFMARAYAESGDWKRVWRVLRWLNTTPGARAGSWFEFYGERLSPPFPQVGITPWTWAEMLILLVQHFIGIRAEVEHFQLRPRLLSGIRRIEASFPLREGRVHLDIRRSRKKSGFRSDGTIKRSSKTEATFWYPKKEIWIEAFIP